MKRPSLNHAYRLVWNAIHQRWMVAPETARSRGKAGGRVKPLAAAVAVALGLAGQSAAWADSCGGGTTTITGAVTDACSLGAGESLVVQNGASITTSGEAVNVLSPHTAGSIDNSGSISATGAYRAGIQIQDGATLGGGLVNSSTGSISGDYGVWVQGTLQNGLSNQGTILGNVTDLGAVTIYNGSVQGGITNSGQILGTDTGLYGYNSTIDGGIVNQTGGVIRGGNTGIRLHDSSVTGGISNAGMIEQTDTGGGRGIQIYAFSTISGGITNSGTISAYGHGIEIVGGGAVVSGGITNTGGIDASDTTWSDESAIRIAGGGTLNDGIANTGTLQGRVYGINLSFNGTLNGDIDNSGTIRGVQRAGIEVGGELFGNIVNQANGSIQGGLTGISVSETTLTGGIINAGTIIGSGSSDGGIEIYSSTITGAITNSGQISGASNGMLIRSGHIQGGILNQAGGTISGSTGDAVYVSDSIIHSIANHGTLSGHNLGLGLFSSTTISNGITNTGTISGATGIYITDSTVTGGLTNSGEITGSGSDRYAVYVENTASLDSITIQGNDTALFDRVVHAPSTPLTVASGATFSPINMNRFEVQSFTNDGTLKLLAGRTVDIVGDFVNTGTYHVQVTDSQVGSLNVTGTVTLGGTLEVDASTLTAGHGWGNRVSVISAASLGGTFTSYSDNSLLFDFTPDYLANRLDLVLTATGGGGGGGTTVLDAVQTTGNAPATGAATVFDSLIADFSNNGTTGNAGMDSVIQTFATFTTGQQVSDAVSQTLPLLTGGSQIAAMAAITGINRVVQARQEANRGLSSGDTFYGDKRVWMKPFGSWADQDDRKGVSGYQARTGGIALGVDGVVSDTARLGVSFAYARANADANSSVAPSSTDVDVYQLIGYGSHAIDADTELNFQLGFGRNRNEGRRDLPAFGFTARSKYDSLTATAGVGLGKSFKLSETASFTPSVRADYTWIKDEGYSETGAGALNLNVRERSADELILAVDGKYAKELRPGTTFTANVGLGYDVLNERASITAAYAGAPGAAFTTHGLEPSPWLMRGGLGLVSQMASGMEVSLRYDAEYRQDFLNQSASVKLRWQF